MPKLKCDFDWSNPIASFYTIKSFSEGEGCAHVEMLPDRKSNDYEAMLYNAPSCWFSCGEFGNSCGLVGTTACMLIAVPKVTGRKFPRSLVISCRVTSHQDGVLTFGGEKSKVIDNVALSPFTAKGKLGRHSVSFESVGYDVKKGSILRFAHGSYSAEISRNDIKQKPIKGPITFAVPGSGSRAEETNEGLGELPAKFSELDKELLQKWTQYLLSILAKKGYLIRFDYGQYGRSTGVGLALEPELVRYFFLNEQNVQLLKELEKVRKNGEALSKDQRRAQIEVFGRNSLKKKFNLGSGATISRSQVFGYVTKTLLPLIHDSGSLKNENKTGFDAAIEEKSIRGSNSVLDKLDDDEQETLKAELNSFQGQLTEEQLSALHKLLDSGAYSWKFIKQKVKDFVKQNREDDLF